MGFRDTMEYARFWFYLRHIRRDSVDWISAVIG